VFAVHISDGLLQPSGLLAGGFGAVLLLAIGLLRVDDRDIPRMGLLTSALFVASLIHVPFGIAKVHLLLNAIAGILLGRHVAVAMFIALVFQAFLFAHGGLTTLGVNTVVLTVPALLGAGAFRLLYSRFPQKAAAIGIFVGFFVSLDTICLNAFIVWRGLELESPEVGGTILFAHLPVIIIESILTGVLVRYLARVKPEWLAPPNDSHLPSAT
jgi:cobalt/nickel transport system permease protein